MIDFESQRRRNEASLSNRLSMCAMCEGAQSSRNAIASRPIETSGLSTETARTAYQLAETNPRPGDDYDM